MTNKKYRYICSDYIYKVVVKIPKALKISIPMEYLDHFI